MSIPTDQLSAHRPLRITVDTGGTFTDLVVADEHRVLGLYKVPTVPDDVFEGVRAALAMAARDRGLGLSGFLEQAGLFLYSTTHATNAVIEGKTAKTALLVTAGHRDILYYREGGKPAPFDLSVAYPEPYVPRSLTFGVVERVLATGAVVVDLDESALSGVLRRLEALEVDAVAVCLLWSHVNPTHELRMGQLLSERLPHVELTLSHQLNPIIREYRRAISAALDASLKPLMRKHLHEIEERLRGLGYRGTPLMVSHVEGGVQLLTDIAEQPLHTVDSGPALAPLSGRQYAIRETGRPLPDAIVIDAGGTSTEVSVIVEGELTFTSEKWLGPAYLGHMTGMRGVHTASAGAGGGSIASVGRDGVLAVGPQSAGASPGPACYGRGGHLPTVTDAATVLGLIDPDYFLGGRIRLDREAAAAAIDEHVAGPLGLSVVAAARAIMAVSTESVRSFIENLAQDQGVDPRTCVLVAGGGSSGLNVAALAKELGVQRVLVPSGAALLSAIGGQFADVSCAYSVPWFTTSERFDFENVNRVLGGLSERVRVFAKANAFGQAVEEYECSARYSGQNWEIDLTIPAGCIENAQAVEAMIAQFHDRHRRLYAVNQPGQSIQFLMWRGRSRVIPAKPELAAAHLVRAEPAELSRPVAWRDEPKPTPVHRGHSLRVGRVITGPSIIDEATTTIVLPDETRATKTVDGNYWIEVGT